VKIVNHPSSTNRPQIVAGSVVIALDDSSGAALLEHAQYTNKLGDKCLLVFGPNQAVYDKEYAPFIGQQVSIEVTSVISNPTTQIAFVRLPDGLNGPKVPYIVVSLVEGTSKESAADLLQYVDDEDALPLLVLSGTIEFAPAMGGWMAERDRRLAARAAETGPDAIASNVVDAAPGFAAEIDPLRCADPAVAHAAIDPKKVIGSRGRYLGCPGDAVIDLADFYCTDSDGPKRKRQWLEDLEGAVVSNRLQVNRGADGNMKSATTASRSISAKRPAGWVWESKNSKRDGSLKFVAAIMEFNPQLFARLGYFQGKEHRVAEVGGVKFNLFDLASRDTPLTGVYRGEVKIRIHEYRHSTDPGKSKAVARYYVNGNMVDRGGPKPTHRLYLLSANQEAPAGAIVLRGPGQAQIVLEKL
jgi:hypothetical protein